MDSSEKKGEDAEVQSLQYLSDVFLFDGDPKHVIMVQLMRTCLLLSAYGGDVLETIPFSNVVGARAQSGGNRRASTLEIFVYRKTGGPRVRHCMNFVLDSRGEQVANLAACHQWSKAIQCRSRHVELEFINGELCIPETHGRRFLIYYNPFSGTGKSEAMLKTTVLPLLADGDCSHQIVESLEAGYVLGHIKTVDLSCVDCIMIISGDGLVFEIINGLMERSDHERAIQIPLAIVPAGSGNAINASICYQTKESNAPANAAFICVKGQAVELDVVEITGSGGHLFSVLSVEYGLLAEIDIASENFRHLGAARFTIGFWQKLIMHQLFPTRFSYLPAKEDGSCPCGNPATNCTCLPALDSGQPLSSDWVVREGDYVFLQPSVQTHLTERSQFRHQAKLCDGRIHIVAANAQCGRKSIVQMFLEMGNLRGKIDVYDGVSDISALAFRIEPIGSGSYHMAIDGEQYPYGSVQGRVHGGLARIIAKLE